jgi:natural resistance-associated macrophage protein
MAVCFFLNFFIVKPDAAEVAFGAFIPTVPAGAVTPLIGLIGSIIMPHNLYLHSSLVLSRKINIKSKTAIHEANVYNAVESGISLFISFLINFAVVGTFAFYFIQNPALAANLNLSNANIALEGSFGSGAKYIWAVGLLAAGQSSTMTGTYAGQFVMEGFFNIKLPVWKRVTVTRAIAILPAISVAFIHDFDAVDTYINIL